MKFAIPLFISLLVAVFFYNTNLKEQPLLSTMVYPDAKQLPEFKLTDHKNQPFTNDRFIDKWSVLFFGFTHCPDVCPTTMAALAQVANNLKPQTLNKVQFIFVSVDPERDTIENLAKYVPFYHPDFIAITGHEQQLLPFSLSLGAMYMKVPTAETYTMSHSGTIFIVDPKGRRYGIFSKTPTGSFDIAAVTQDLETIVGSYTP